MALLGIIILIPMATSFAGDCGNVNGSIDGNVNILDVTFLINLLYKLGPAPNPLQAADVNDSGQCQYS